MALGILAHLGRNNDIEQISEDDLLGDIKVEEILMKNARNAQSYYPEITILPKWKFLCQKLPFSSLPPRLYQDSLFNSIRCLILVVKMLYKMMYFRRLCFITKFSKK